MNNLTFGSLFAGVGGFDLGFEKAGWRCGFQVEWDKHCQQILARHWPDVPRWSDVSTVNGAELPPVDCITFGSPCQDLSVAGKRAGLDGGRSGLFFEATRIIKEMRYATGNQYPRVAVWENVPGALSSNKGADFAAVLDNLADSGALAIEWAVLDAQHFGIPQRRRRIFLVAIYDPAIARNCGTQILPVTQGIRRNTKKGNQEREITAALTANGVGTCGTDDNQAQAGHLITAGFSAGNSAQARGIAYTVEGTPPLRAGESGTNQVPTIVQPFVKVVRSGARDANGELPAEVWREEQTAPTFNSMDNTGESRATVIFTAQRVGEPPRIYEDTTPSLLSRMGTGGNNVPMIAEATPTISFGWQENFYAGQTYNEITTALTTTKTPAILNNYAVRRLTPIECERLMGWPDDHTAGQADSHRYKQCGNGVAAPVAYWVAQQLRRIINGD